MAVSAIVMVLDGCSSTEGRNAPASEALARGAGVGSGGAGANLKDDEEFVHDVASKNIEELELSRMALEKATSPEVKAFAQMMLRDHADAEGKFRSVVSEEGLAWPKQLDDKHREAIDDLQKQGSDFDRHYVKAIVEAHQNLTAKLESRLDTASLAEWKTAAAGRAQGTTMPEPKAAMADVQVRPNKSDNTVTLKVNQWAADIYPIAQKHLDTARALQNATTRQ